MATSVEHGMARWKGRVAVVTGASTGIGYETAKHLALSGMTVVGCARNTSKIEVRVVKTTCRQDKIRIACVCRVSPQSWVQLVLEKWWLSSVMLPRKRRCWLCLSR